jgi:ribosomal protein L37AE/L43A
MKDDLTRRGFLKAAGLAVAGVTGASLLSRSGWAQEEEKKPEEDKKDQEEPKAEEEPKEEPNYDDLVEEKESEEPTEPIEPTEEETRACPQCGALMYRQGRTWTCENCGYSYVNRKFAPSLFSVSAGRSRFFRALPAPLDR